MSVTIDKPEEILDPGEATLKHTTWTGLSAVQVAERRARYGLNVLPTEKPSSPWTLLVNQLKSPLIYIILFAAGVSLVVGEIGDFSIIMAVVVIDVILGFIQEYQAQKTYSALKGLLKPVAMVIRDGQRQEVEVSELVPDDLVLLQVGEHIPADGKLLESTKLSVDEAILTGESEPVSKHAAQEDLLDEVNLVAMGTTVVTGRGLMQVLRTGLHTELGLIAASLQELEEADTPLQVRLKAFSKTLTYIVILFTALILVTGMLLQHGFLEMLRTAIILAIAAVPEGLLIAVTVILVLGMRKILKRNGLVKQMLAVETLGSVTVICTDKTGTLTEGRMRVTRSDFNDPQRAFQAMVLCNNLEGPVEAALWEYSESQYPGEAQRLVNETSRISEELFSSETKFMSAAVLQGDQRFDYLKGAPEIVLGMCLVTQAEIEKVQQQIDEWAGEGLRLLGLAYRQHRSLEDHNAYTWIGLVAMEDPIRPEVIEAIQVAQKAGIRTKMITGDYRRTAERIGRNIGLITDGDQVMTGPELAALDDDSLRQKARTTSIFARIRPQDKLRIVRALQQDGEITAMIGDGVNDAPALQRANIGVVVGGATDVAKETADVILLDSNFRTIVAAVEEGRIIFENIRKVVAYTLSNSFAEVLTVFTAMMLGWPTPLAVAQILWIHLICDGPSDIVLGFEPKESGIMDEPPKSLKEPILTRLGGFLIATISIASATAALMLFYHFFKIHRDPVEGRSLVFASFALNSMVYIFAYRSMRTPIWRLPPLSQNKPLVWAVLGGVAMAIFPFLVPGLRRLLGIVPLTGGQWLFVSCVAVGLLVIVELAKFIANRGYSRNHTS